MLVPKSKGAGIMISDFTPEQDGFLQLSVTSTALSIKLAILECHCDSA